VTANSVEDGCDARGARERRCRTASLPLADRATDVATSLVGHRKAALFTGAVVGPVVGAMVGAVVGEIVAPVVGVTVDVPLPPPPHEASATTRTTAANRAGITVMGQR